MEIYYFFRSFHGISFTFNWKAVRKAGNSFLEGQPRQVLVFDSVIEVDSYCFHTINEFFKSHLGFVLNKC
jgi:hypothetical protein